MHKCCEFSFLILLCSPMYELQFAAHVFPALSLAHVKLLLISLGQSLFPPSSPRLVVAKFVRGLLRYYRTVRLPAIVHCCITPFGFSTRTLVLSFQGRLQDLPVPVHGVSIHVWGLRPRRVQYHLALAT